MTHKISDTAVHRYRKAPSDTTISKAASAQNNIRDILGPDYETFLQGSYKNDTSTSDFNDVDIVAVVKQTHSGTFSSKVATSSVSWDHIFSAIEAKLNASPLYRGKFTRADKCITINAGITVDVVPAVHITDATQDPIAIFSFREDRERLNHPRVHYANGKSKNERTSGHYKPVTRMMKAWAAAHFDGTDVAPSFYIESMVHSAPDNLFTSDHAVSFVRVALDMTTKLAGNGPVLNVAGTKNIFDEWDQNKRLTVRNQLLASLQHIKNALDATSESDANRHWHAAFGN